jgi:hypothetical protein
VEDASEPRTDGSASPAFSRQGGRGRDANAAWTVGPSREATAAGAGPCHRSRVRSRVRVVGRRVVVVSVVVLQLALVARGYWSDHKEFAFQMFPESSTWRAEVVRITTDGRRVPVERPWSGYRWDELVSNRGLRYPSVRHHADAGLANQLAFLEAALDWVADNTPRDRETRYLEATVTSWHNADAPRVELLRSRIREGAG